jgi:hypothetical protein
MSTDAIGESFTRYAASKLRRYMAQISRCCGLLSETEIWQRDNPHCNAIGNLLLHLRGNITQWIVEGVGGESYERDRAAEFAARDGGPASALVGPLNDAVERACGIILSTRPETLATPRTIQGYEITTAVAIFHVTEHFAFHTGQIVHVTKQIRNVDLSLYDSAGHLLVGDDEKLP